MSKFSAKDYGKLLDWATANKVGDEKLASFFVDEIVKNNDFSKIKNAFKIFEELARSRENIKKVKVISAHVLENEVKKELTEFICKNFNISENNLNVNYEIDEKIIGGVKIFVEDELIDLSISNKIGELRKVLLK